MNEPGIKEERESMRYQISTEAFERALRLIIGWWINRDETAIKELLDIEHGLLVVIAGPFNKELNQNLLSRATEQMKEDVISFYISEFLDSESLSFFKHNHEIIFEGTLSYDVPSFGRIEYTNNVGEKKQLKEYEKYVIYSHMLFDWMLYYIQLACVTYNIDFYKICERLGFDTTLFDTHITDEFIERAKLGKQPTHESFTDIFAKPNYEKYIDPLTECEPQLLNKNNGKYNFIGKSKKHTGCVAAYFGSLRQTGIIKQSINRDGIAIVLSKEIQNYKVSGATVDNMSSTYVKTFKKQLEELLKNIN